jgi:hypothetical protein
MTLRPDVRPPWEVTGAGGRLGRVPSVGSLPSIIPLRRTNNTAPSASSTPAEDERGHGLFQEGEAAAIPEEPSTGRASYLRDRVRSNLSVGVATS